MSPIFRIPPEERAAEKARELVRALPMAATLDVLRNCLRDEFTTDWHFDFSMETLIPPSPMRIKGKN